MKIMQTPKGRGYYLAVALVMSAVFLMALEGAAHAGLWSLINEKMLMWRLIGRGDFISYQRNVDTKDPSFPLEVLNDGFKMIRVYQDFPGNYMVEWRWRAVLKNRSSGAVKVTFEYKLQDKDAFLLASSKEFFKTLAAGEQATIEKTANLPFETAKQVAGSNWYIIFQK